MDKLIETKKTDERKQKVTEYKNYILKHTCDSRLCHVCADMDSEVIIRLGPATIMSPVTQISCLKERERERELEREIDNVDRVIKTKLSIGAY